MTTDGQGSLAQRLTGIDEIECVTPDLNGVPRGKVMTAEGFLEGRRLQLARGVLLQCIMGGYPPARFYGSDDGDLALIAEPTQIHRLPWSDEPRALAICDADELDGHSGLLEQGRGGNLQPMICARPGHANEEKRVCKLWLCIPGHRKASTARKTRESGDRC